MDLTTIISIPIGGFITWFCAWLYYRRASIELLESADELSELSEFLIQYIMADKGTGTIVPRIREGGLSLDKYVGAEIPKGAWDEWNSWLEKRRKKRARRTK